MALSNEKKKHYRILGHDLKPVVMIAGKGLSDSVLAELERVATEGVTAAELTKARDRRLASFWRSLQTISGKASALGNFETFTGDYENLFAVPERLGETTADQLQAVAAEVFRRSNMTTGILRSPQEDDAS